MLKRILKDEEETRDALQDLMAKLWSKRDELGNCQNLQAYIVTVAKNYSFDLLKRRRIVNFSENGEKQFYQIESDEVSPDLNCLKNTVRLSGCATSTGLPTRK
jgi:RNA polymerase sigma-70 factor (ECF subfamily)